MSKGPPFPQYIAGHDLGASGKWTLLPVGGINGGSWTGLRGGKAKIERRKLLQEKRLRSQLHLPLFTSPLEKIPAGIRKVQNTR